MFIDEKSSQSVYLFVVLILILPVFLVPESVAAAKSSGRSRFNFETDAGSVGIDIHAKLQPRYEYKHREKNENESSFGFKRAELDFRGYFLTKKIGWRLKPELKGPTLLDAWIDYRFSESLKLKIGQQIVSWGWERATPCSKHLFAERSAANDFFQWPTGLDVGMQLHGKYRGLKYFSGMFDGRGKIAKNNKASQGNLYTARVEYSLLGEDAKPEAIVKPVNGARLSVGGGMYYANRSHVRDWALDSASDTPAVADDVFSYTANVSYQHNIYTFQLQGFAWAVDPVDRDDFRGKGYTVGGGALLYPEKLFASARFSYVDPDTSRRELKEREIYLGLQWYHRGHNWKTSFEIGRESDYNGNNWTDNDVYRIQQQFCF
jgi:hypothetical protein